jgi:hypothetical protein
MVRKRIITLNETPMNVIAYDRVDIYDGAILVEFEDDIIGSVVLNPESSEFEIHVVGHYDASNNLETLIKEYPHYNFIFIDN